MNLKEVIAECATDCTKPTGVNTIDHFYHQYATSSQVIDFPNYYRFLYKIGKYVNKYVELGCYKGWAAMHMVQFGADAHIVDVDNGLCSEAVEHKNITFYQRRSVDPSLISRFDDKSIDVLLIDSDHTYQTTKDEYHFWHNKVRDGGLILFDDIDYSGYGCGKFFYELDADKVSLPHLHDGGWGFGIVSV